MHEFFKLIKRLNIQGRYMLLLLLRSPFDVIRTYMQAVLLMDVFSCLETGRADRLPEVCIGWGLLCAVLFLYNGIVWSIYAAFSAGTEARLQKELTDQILFLPYRLVQRRGSGEWFTRRNGDIQAVMTMMNGPLHIPHWMTSLVNTILSSFLLLKCSPVLFAVTGAFILPYYLLHNCLVIKRLPGFKDESRKVMADIASSIKPLITDAEVIAIYDAGGMMLKKCEEDSRRLMKINLKMQLCRGLGDLLSRLFGISGYLALLLAGFAMVSGGTMAFSSLVYCSQMRGGILSGLLMLMTCMSNIKENAVCAKKVNESLEE